ncbi:hypothetical protein PR048_007779 [Dryococelus australis]|uniref:DUF4219 domain-containing protein n=1 Tax=Dryococelus australis TaxID=614101 RepID=A0ABQ9HVL8_9NEOP|nr:hypothetical protein PR048_007779 [Dryococelus australis]
MSLAKEKKTWIRFVMAAGQVQSPFPPIEKLARHENYDIWHFAMRTYLEHEELWQCVMGKEKDDKKTTRALAKIILSIGSVNYVHVQDISTRGGKLLIVRAINSLKINYQ